MNERKHANLLDLNFVAIIIARHKYVFRSYVQQPNNIPHAHIIAAIA